MQLITVASAALFAASALASSPIALVANKCDYPVYLWSVSADGSSDMITLDSHNGTYNETYQTPSVGGVSLKLSINQTVANPTPITQFEYTLEGGSIWYDISNVNCGGEDCPFSGDGMYMESGTDCPTRSCAAGVAKCQGAYNAYNDDWNSLACVDTASIELYLCTSSAPNATTTASSNGDATKREEHAHRHQHRHPHWRH